MSIKAARQLKMPVGLCKRASPPSLLAAKEESHSRRQKITEKCVAFCCKDLRPFRCIEGEGFRELAQQLIHVGAVYGPVAAQDVLPDPTTVSKRCHEMAKEERKRLVAQLNEINEEVKTIGMTTDIWTEDFHKLSYMAITCHFVTRTFKLVSKVLTTAVFPQEEAKTGDNIRREILRLLTEYGLDMSLLNKVVWVTDQGSNIISALRPYHRLDCQDHLYNTLMRHALNLKGIGRRSPNCFGNN